MNPGTYGIIHAVGNYAPPADTVWQIKAPQLNLSTTSRFEPIWDDRGSGADRDGAFYRTHPPAGFFSIGDYGQGRLRRWERYAPWRGRFAMMRGTYGRSWALLCVLGTLLALSGCTRWWRQAIAEGFQDATYRPKPSDPVKLDKFLLSEQGSLFLCGDVIRAGEGAGTRTFVVYFPLPRSDATVDLDAPRPVPEIGFGKGNYGHCSLGHKRHRKLFPEDTGWRVVRPRLGGTRLSLEAFERGEIPEPADGDVAIYPIEVPEGRRYLFYGPAVPGGPRLAILLKTEGRFLRRLWRSN